MAQPETSQKKKKKTSKTSKRSSGDVVLCVLFLIIFISIIIMLKTERTLTWLFVLCCGVYIHTYILCCGLDLLGRLAAPSSSCGHHYTQNCYYHTPLLCYPIILLLAHNKPHNKPHNKATKQQRDAILWRCAGKKQGEQGKEQSEVVESIIFWWECYNNNILQ